MQDIIKLSRYNSQNYASVVINDYEVAFLRERKNATFLPFLYHILFIACVV